MDGRWCACILDIDPGCAGHYYNRTVQHPGLYDVFLFDKNRRTGFCQPVRLHRDDIRYPLGHRYFFRSAYNLGMALGGSHDGRACAGNSGSQGGPEAGGANYLKN